MYTRISEFCLASLFLALTVLMATVCMAGTQSGTPENLLHNGGFETGMQGWLPDKQLQRVTDAQQAHGGAACLTGEVTGPNQALRLVREVKVRSDSRYELQLWAKATNRTKLVVWGMLPGSSTRTMIASWPTVPRRWTRYHVAMDVPQTGKLRLEIIAPSSYGAPAGRMWIDDLALYETRMPPAVHVSRGGSFDDEPAMAAARDGSIYVAYNRFANDTDSLQIDRFCESADGLTRCGSWQIAGGPRTYLLHPDAVGAGKRVWITYAQEIDGNWDLFAVACGPDGPGQPVALTQAAGVDVKPDTAWHEGRLWVAWESNRSGFRQVFVTSLADGKVADAVQLSRPRVSSYDPSIVVLDGGQACVAWHAFADGNYDIHLRRTGDSGRWSEPVQLTRAPTIDRHAALFARGSELWIAYENAQTEQYNVTRTNQRHLVVARVEADALKVPHVVGASVLEQRCEAAAPVFDGQGRLWVALLRPRLPRAGWDVFLTGWSGRQWLQPIPLSRHKGMDRTPSLVVRGERAYLAYQGDDTPQSWSDLDHMAEATSDIYVGTVELADLGASTKIPLATLIESSEPFPPAALRVDRGEDTPTPSIRYRDTTYQLYFGDLHEHSDVSVCNRVGDQSLDESYQHLRDLARHDFVCITDHGYNLNHYLWNYSAKLARTNDDPQRFLTFLGQEWTSTFEETNHDHPYGFYGHRNLILADLYFPNWWNARNRQTPAQVWEDLRKMQANFVHIPHQLADTGNVPTDWNFHDEVAQPVAEIFQTRGSYEYLGAPRQAKRAVPKRGYFLQDAWARDIVIGVIASPDHGGGYGKACVYAEQLTRESILDALRARRCYGTTAAKIILDVRVNGHLMGEKLAQEAGDSVKVDVRVRCPMPIRKVELCRSNQYIDSAAPQGRDATVTFLDQQPLAGRCYYYVRVTQEDEEIAWSSPVWFGVEDQQHEAEHAEGHHP